MTLLKRLQERARNWYIKNNDDGFSTPNMGQLEELDTLITTTVTAVLDEVEREVEFRQKGWIGAEEDGSDRDPRYDELETVLDIIKSKRTEV